jgi:HEAT repeat protein
MSNSLNELITALDYIYSLEEKGTADKTDLDRLSVLAKSEYSEVRTAVSEVLVCFYNEDSEKILVKMLDDSDSLVQASACDSLGCSKSSVVLCKLCDMSRNKSFLVRGYAAFSIGDVQLNIGGNHEKTAAFLKKWLKREKSVWVKTAIARSLFILGNRDYLDYLLKQLENGNYKIRYMALNCLSEFPDMPAILDKSAVQQMISALKERLNNEKVKYAKEKIRQLIELYEDRKSNAD